MNTKIYVLLLIASTIAFSNCSKTGMTKVNTDYYKKLSLKKDNFKNQTLTSQTNELQVGSSIDPDMYAMADAYASTNTQSEDVMFKEIRFDNLANPKLKVKRFKYLRKRKL